MNIDMIKANDLIAGQHFFNRETMRFFHSRVFSTVYGGKYFITSEVNPSGEKRYSVREAIDRGKRIKTPHFFAHKTLEGAKAEARELSGIPCVNMVQLDRIMGGYDQ